MLSHDPFFRKKDGTLLFFFPHPLTAPPALRENDKDRKAFAGWKLASLEVFHHLINGEVTEEQIRKDFCTHSSSATNGDATVDKNYVCLDKKYLLTRKEYREIEKVWRSARLFAETDLTRTRIDRRNGGAAEGKLFFTQEVLTTDKHSGYFFLIRASQEIWQKWEEPLAAALAFLADRGLGGDISAGRGKLKDLKLEPFSGLREPGPAHETPRQRFVMLSLYYPAEKELPTFQDCWYRLLPRKGKVEITYLREANPFKTKIQMFAEGSTFLLSSLVHPQGQNPTVQRDPIEQQFAVTQ